MTFTVLFDLDGTLVDPVEGITRSFAHALETLGIQAPQVGELRRYIGPPLADSLAQLLPPGNPALLPAAIAAYRDRYERLGVHENTLYSGVEPCLTRLRALRVNLFVATSKPTVYARQIVEEFGLTDYFEAVHGSQLDGTRADKAELISHVLTTECIDPRNCVMIGDRKYDILGSRAAGVQAIAVGWGYGNRAEHEAARPHAIVDSWSQLLGAVASLVASATPTF